MSMNVEKVLQEHTKLFENPMSKIGEIHCTILKSQKIVEDQRRDDKDFETEIGYDEIHWWVFYKEKDLKELKSETKEALETFQKMKEDSVKLRQSLQPKRYSELIDGMKRFCVEHESEIQILLDYVKWLEQRDPRALYMLFTYRVWGSTRRGDRTIIIGENYGNGAINAGTEVALGLRTGYQGPVIGAIFSNISYEHFESMQPEDYSLKPIVISEEEVMSRASAEILIDMSEYFEFLRNSLRNILLEIDEFETSDNILHNDNFWKSFVRKVMTLSIENKLWDFKEILPMWNAKGEVRKEKEVEFAEDVASFGNTKGGVLIIGISNQIPRKVVGIDDLENRIKYAKDVILHRIDSESDYTHFQPLVLKDENNVERTCLLIVIKRMMNVVGVRNEKDQFTYPIRNETGITRVTRNEVNNSKIGLKHNDYQFLSTLETNYSKKS